MASKTTTKSANKDKSKKKDKKETLDKLVDEKTEEQRQEAENMREKLLEEINSEDIPKSGDTLEGKVIDASKNAIYVDLGKFGVGVVRGRELWETIESYSEIELGDKISATVLDLENEEGNVELSFRKASREAAWKELIEKMESGEVITVKVQGANKGGLLTIINGIPGFLPVSQLSSEHYPRVEGGDQDKILSKLRDFVGKKVEVKILTAEPKEDKLIISEKEIEVDKIKDKLVKYKVGDIVEGIVSGVVDFGIFMKFNDLEGLVHISELSWQRVENPSNLFKVGDKVKAQIIGIEDARIILSIKRLTKDPWLEEIKKFKTGDTVNGKIVKLAPYGAFVQLSDDVHGLIHISEVSSTQFNDIRDVLRVGETKEMKILSIEPDEHRLGLSLKALEKKEDKDTSKKKETKKKDENEEKEEKDKNTKNTKK